MDNLLTLLLSPLGRALLLSLTIGIAMQGLKSVSPKGTLRRALLPLWAVLGGGVSGLLPNVLTGEATLLLGAGAGALSATVVETYNRYKDHLAELALKRLAGK
jgi:hypothetical protein